MELNSELDRLKKYAPIEAELQRAKKKHPDFPTDMFRQLAIMNEEAGEVTKAVLHYHYEGGSKKDIEEELMQTAAMCMRMLEQLHEENTTSLESLVKLVKTQAESLIKNHGRIDATEAVVRAEDHKGVFFVAKNSAHRRSSLVQAAAYLVIAASEIETNVEANSQE